MSLPTHDTGVVANCTFTKEITKTMIHYHKLARGHYTKKERHHEAITNKICAINSETKKWAKKITNGKSKDSE